jgi:hypothetical protein
MRTTERLTVTVSRPIAEAVRAQATRSGSSVSALTDRALRDYLLRQAMASRPQVTDDEWLEVVAETVEASSD